MYLEVLGILQLSSANEKHTLAPKRPFLLLSYLAYRQTWVTRDEILALFWPEKSEQDARHSLRQLLYSAKKEIYAEALLVTEDKLSTNVSSDVQEFQAALEKGAWAKALELYNGDFLEGIFNDNSYAVEQWLTLTRHDLKNSWHYAVLKHSAELNATKEYDSSIQNLQKALEKDELSEEFLQALLRVQMQAGYIQEAKQSYEKFCFRLEQELELEPSEQTQELFATIVQLKQRTTQITPHDASSEASTVKKQVLSGQTEDLSQYLNDTLKRQHPNTESLPFKHDPYNNTSALTPFVGRAQELAKLDRFILSPERILTITGLGGIGKTRLSEQFLIEQAHNFRHGSIEVSLASIWVDDATPDAKVHSIEAIATAVAYALELKLSGIETVKEQVLSALKNKEMLILLDNFEQLKQVSSFVAELANASPQSKIVVTSRVTLGLAGEMVYDLQGLTVPSMTKTSTLSGDVLSTKTSSLKTDNSYSIEAEALERYDAIALFLASARRMNKPLVLDADTQSFLINICQLLEGIPLAIELAATWLRLLSLPQLHKELCKGFNLLSNLNSNVDYKNERHHSLKTVFDYSWSLLNASQQTVLAKLAVFQSPFSLEAAQSVTGSSLIDLLTLVNSSLLQQDEADYLSVHKFTQAYLQLKLQDMPNQKEETQEAYKHYYVAWLAEQRDGFNSQKEKSTLDLIEKATDNINAVWEQMAQAKDYLAFDQVLYSRVHYLKRKGLFKEGYSKFSQAYASLSELLPTAQDDLLKSTSPSWLSAQTSSLARALAKLLIYRGKFQWRLKNEDAAINLCEAGLRLEAFNRPYFKQDTEYLTPEIALGNHILAIIKMLQGNTDSAKTYYHKTLEVHQKLELKSGMASCYNNLGILSERLGDFEEGKQYALKSLEIQKNLGNLSGVANSLHLLGILARLQNNFAVAHAYFQQSLSLRIQMNDLLGQLTLLNDLGLNAYIQDNYSDAEKYWLQALALQQANDIQPNMYIFLNLGRLAVVNQDSDKAVSFFLQACDLEMISYDQIQLVLSIGIIFLENWQQEDTAAMLFEQVRKSPVASADNRRVAQEKFEQLPEFARSKALTRQRNLQEVHGQIIKDLSAMQKITTIDY